MANESIRAAFERMWQHTVAKIEDEVAGLEGGGTNVLVVTAEWDEENEYCKASHTSQQIYNHVHSGGHVVLKYDNQMYSLASCTESSAYFNYYDDGYVMYCIEIYQDEFYRYTSCVPVNADWVHGELGFIDEALDAIIAIQRELIGEITFFMPNGSQQQAEKGMTWGEWIESDYNKSGYVLINGYVNDPLGNGIYDYADGGMPETADAMIIAGHYYVYD